MFKLSIPPSLQEEQSCPKHRSAEVCQINCVLIPPLNFIGQAVQCTKRSDLEEQSCPKHRSAEVCQITYVLTCISKLSLSQAKLYNEKRSDLEEQQLHLNIGLQKIRETVEQVEELQKSLSVKRIELEEKNAAANAKLKQMVSGILQF